MRVTSRCPSRWWSVYGAAKAHSIGTCWSSNIPSSNARGSRLTNASASAFPVTARGVGAPTELGVRGVGCFGVEAVGLQRIGDDLRLDVASARECGEDGDH